MPGMQQFFKDITTTKDGDSFDVVRVAMTINIFMLPWVLLWGIIMVTIGFFLDKPFPLLETFQAILAFETGVGTLLAGGSAALWLKKSTEPNGDTTTTMSLKQKG